jgi:hypothetical protein
LQEFRSYRMRKSSPQLPISISPLRQQEAPGSWLLCNGETQSSASCFRIFTCASPWVAPGSWLLAPGSWLLAPGSWLLAPGSCS